MKAIQLHTAKQDAEGVRRDAGEVLLVPKEVDAKTAAEWIAAGLAAEAPAPEASKSDA